MDNVVSDGIADQIANTVATQPRHDMCAMCLNRLCAEVQQYANFLAAIALGQQLDNEIDDPTEYYVFDYATQTKHQISVEELKKGAT